MSEISVKKSPKFSIITVCKNDLQSLRSTCSSIWAQSFEDWEHIVVDSCSTDGTDAFLMEHNSVFSEVIIEPDDGIYHAMNKGLKRALGEYLVFLNAGDVFLHQNVLNLVQSSMGDEDLVYGGVVVLNRINGKLTLKDHAGFDRIRLMLHTICHQAIFAKRELFESQGAFDELYSLCSDYDWLLRIFRNQDLKSKFLDYPVVIYDNSGITKRKPELRLREKREIRKKYYGSFSIILVDLIQRTTPGALRSKKIRWLLSVIVG